MIAAKPVDLSLISKLQMMEGDNACSLLSELQPASQPYRQTAIQTDTYTRTNAHRHTQREDNFLRETKFSLNFTESQKGAEDTVEFPGPAPEYWPGSH